MTANTDTVGHRYEAVVSLAHSLLGRDAFDFDHEELRSVVMLAVARDKLVRDGDRLDTHSEKGRKGCARFLKKVEKVALALSLESAPREYRSKFTADVRAMFSGSQRNYRVDILEAALSLAPAPGAGAEAPRRGGALAAPAAELREALLGLGRLLDAWASPQRGPERARGELCARLRRFDAAWAGFEEAYVEGLSLARQRSRDLLARAVLQDRRLRSAEARLAGQGSAAAMDECRQQEAALLELLGDLSAAAGIPRPSTQVPELALQVLGEAVQEVAIAGPLRGEGPHVPSVVLAARAVESYRGLREYLACARERLDELRPQLRENEGLAERLACWEDSWERFAFYTENPHLMEGVHALASFLARALRAAPSLQQMLEDRDAELFLVLPRLVCLCLLSGLERPVAQLLRPLLPCHFADSSAQPGGDQAPAASAQFEGVLELLGGSAEHGAWEALLRRAVAGAGAAAAAGACPEAGPGRREAAAGAVEGLMREVEGWSMELQRYHPVAWNDLASVLVQCLVWGPGDVEAACPTRFVL